MVKHHIAQPSFSSCVSIGQRRALTNQIKLRTLAIAISQIVSVFVTSGTARIQSEYPIVRNIAASSYGCGA